MNKTLYNDAHKNALRISSFTIKDDDLPLNGIAIKWVLTGKEKYHTWNLSHVLQPNDFLLLNDLHPCHVNIRSKEPSVGICIDLSASLIKEVLDINMPSESELFQFIFSDLFPVRTHKLGRSALGQKLAVFHQHSILPMANNPLLMQEHFYALAHAFVKDQENVLTNYKGLSFKKSHSGKSVLCSLLMIREYMLDNLCKDLSLDELSKQACMSKYNFIRRFTQAFGDSPYRFINKQRLMRAKEDLEKGFGIEQTAHKFRFYDVPAFHRAFKNEYHSTPAQHKKGNILQVAL
ncbi:MAG: helix-turn-helix domain-containing protein [Bacteroidota bacterium]|jgi:AraC family transcriptional regulator